MRYICCMRHYGKNFVFCGCPCDGVGMASSACQGSLSYLGDDEDVNMMRSSRFDSWSCAFT
eukprot:1825409-Amphidinium_carterae.2